MFQVKKKASLLIYIILTFTEGYSQALIYLFHLTGSDAPLCSTILLMYTSNLFLEKPRGTEKR